MRELDRLPTAQATAPVYKMTVHFTKYEEGNAIARLALIGLGGIRMDGTISIIDASGALAGQYMISKKFTMGGIGGAVVSRSDVQDGFAKSVAAILSAKAAETKAR